MLPRYSIDRTVGVVFYVYLFGKMTIDSVLDDAVLTMHTFAVLSATNVIVIKALPVGCLITSKKKKTYTDVVSPDKISLHPIVVRSLFRYEY